MTETTTEHGAFTLHDFTALQTIIGAVQGNKKIRWSFDGGQHIQEGVARALTRNGGGFIDADSDLRDAYVWISSTFESWVLLTDLIPLVSAGCFGVDP